MDKKNCRKHSSDIHKGKEAIKGSHYSNALGSRTKPPPSKWDDAQKWLVGFTSAGDDIHSKSKPRNSNAEDRRLLHSASQRGRDSCSSADAGFEEDQALRNTALEEGETKKMDYSDVIWRIDSLAEDSRSEFRTVSLRDVGTEMTPVASQEPSRTATPIRAMTPVFTSPTSSRSSTPGRCQYAGNSFECLQTGMKNLEKNKSVFLNTVSRKGWSVDRDGESYGKKVEGGNDLRQNENSSSIEARAMAWDEAERAKYMARFKREEVKIQSWENHEKINAEIEMKKIEVRAERLKSRAQEKLANKLAVTRRIAEEKRSNAESMLNESAARTAAKADYFRRTGHLSSSFWFKFPSLCG